MRITQTLMTGALLFFFFSSCTSATPKPEPKAAESSGEVSAPSGDVLGDGDALTFDKIPANEQVGSFRTAKKHAALIHEEYGKTWYCGCDYLDKFVDHASCGYEPKHQSSRSDKVEWEHVVPAHAFGQSFLEWKEGSVGCVDKRGKAYHGRRCAHKSSETFRYIEADLYNLVPAIGEVNGLRSNYPVALIEGEAREFGACDVEISKKRVEPRPEIRGDIARIYFYMESAYPGRGVVSEANKALLVKWSHDDPVSAWECERAARVAHVQGNENPFVSKPCRKAKP